LLPPRTVKLMPHSLNHSYRSLHPVMAHVVTMRQPISTQSPHVPPPVMWAVLQAVTRLQSAVSRVVNLMSFMVPYASVRKALAGSSAQKICSFRSQSEAEARNSHPGDEAQRHEQPYAPAPAPRHEPPGAPCRS